MQEKKQALGIIKILQNHFGVYTDDQLAEKLGSTRSAVSQWKVYDRIPKKILTKYHQIISGAGEKVVVAGQPIHIQKGNKQLDIQHSKDSTSLDAAYIIDLQKDKIKSQAMEIKTLKDALQKKQAESTHWESLEYDFVCDVTLFRKAFQFGRIINSVTDLNKQSKVLGYTASQMKSFWAVGVKYIRMSEHPIEKIINKETQKDVKKQMSTLPILFDAMKATVGDHYIPQPIIYVHKKGHNVGAISYNKVEWSNMKVLSKVKFLVN
jgi:hypothetical protein